MPKIKSLPKIEEYKFLIGNLIKIRYNQIINKAKI